MSFKPSARPAPREDREPGNFPVPKSGNRYARVSLIVDLGTQEREPIYKLGDKIVDEGTEGATKQEQKPCQQVAVFADLINDVVDYGADIGEQQYRLMLNKSFSGVVTGINFTVTPPKDAKGKLIEGKPWGFHAQNILAKLARATGKENVAYDTPNDPEALDISALLGRAFLAEVEVKETPHKEGKKDKDGNLIVYKNVNFKGASKVPNGPDDKPMAVGALNVKAKAITFDNATKEDITLIRAPLRKMIKLASNYAGSAMEKAMQAWEAENVQSTPAAESEGGDEEPAKPKATRATKPKAAQQPKMSFDDMDEDVPF